MLSSMVHLSPPDLPQVALQQVQRLSVANRDAHLRLSGVQKLRLLHTLSNQHCSGNQTSKSLRSVTQVRVYDS